MPAIPKAIADLGLVAVSLFLFVAAIFLILKIVQAVRSKPAPEGDANGRRPRCFESPIVGQLVSVQQTNTRLLEKLEESEAGTATTLALQTQLLERIAAVQEKIGDCIARQDARESVSSRLRIRPGGAT